MNTQVQFGWCRKSWKLYWLRLCYPFHLFWKWPVSKIKRNQFRPTGPHRAQLVSDTQTYFDLKILASERPIWALLDLSCHCHPHRKCQRLALFLLLIIEGWSLSHIHQDWISEELVGEEESCLLVSLQSVCFYAFK